MTDRRTGSYDLLLVPPNRNLTVFLLVIAWSLYLLSLGLPAIEQRHSATGTVAGTMPGWHVVLYLLFPYLWFLGFPFVYLLVNLCFWASPLALVLRGGHRTCSKLFAAALVLSMGVAWAAPLVIPPSGVTWGFYAWAGAISLACLAMLVPPMPRDDAGA